MRKNMKYSAFTLIELIVVIVIISILASIALPSYLKSVEKSKEAEALATLATMYRAWQTYYDTNGVNPGVYDIDIDLPNARGTLNQPSTKYWNYSYGDIKGTGVLEIAYADWYEPRVIRKIGITNTGNFIYYNGLQPSTLPVEPN